jgi:hypothetical protein
MVDYLLSHPLVEISASRSCDTTCGTCKLCVAFISGEYLWIFYQCKEKKPWYLSLFNSSFSTFELLKPPKVSSQICGSLHKNFAYFRTKTCKNTKIYDFLLGGSWFKCYSDSLPIMTLLCGLCQSSKANIYDRFFPDSSQFLLPVVSMSAV